MEKMTHAERKPGRRLLGLVLRCCMDSRYLIDLHTQGWRSDII